MNLVLQTKNLILRPFEFSDAKAYFDLDKNPNVHTYLWNNPPKSLQETQASVEKIIKQYQENKIGRFAVILKETNEFIGWAGIKFCTEPINEKVNFYDIGYRLVEPHWGKGYASEAAFTWLDYGFNEMKIENMTASAHKTNIASNKILSKIGMIKTEEYLENGVIWNWYDLKNPNLK